MENLSYDYPLALFDVSIDRLREEARDLNLTSVSYDDYLRVQIMIYFKIAIEVLGLLEENSGNKTLKDGDLKILKTIYTSLRNMKTSEFQRVFSQYSPGCEDALTLLNLR